jgi:DUF971 family protein
MPMTNAERQKNFRDRHRTLPAMKPATEVKRHMTDEELINYIKKNISLGDINRVLRTLAPVRQVGTLARTRAGR